MDLASVRRRPVTVLRPWGTDGSTIGAGFLLGDALPARRDDNGTRDYRWLLLLAGSGRATDEQGQGVALTPGTCFIRVPSTPHRIERDQDGRWLEFFLRLPIELHAGLVAGGALDPGQRRFTVPLETTLLDHLQICIRRLRGNQMAAVAALTDLFTHVQQASRAPDRLDAARQALESDLDQSRDMAAIAAAAGYSNDGFRLAFRRRFAMNPKAWRIRARIAAAQAHLISGVSVAATAERLGYPDPFTFGKQFRRIVGCSPGRYRLS